MRLAIPGSLVHSSPSALCALTNIVEKPEKLGSALHATTCSHGNSKNYSERGNTVVGYGANLHLTHPTKPDAAVAIPASLARTRCTSSTKVIPSSFFDSLLVYRFFLKRGSVCLSK